MCVSVWVCLLVLHMSVCVVSSYHTIKSELIHDCMRFDRNTVHSLLHMDTCTNTKLYRITIICHYQIYIPWIPAVWRVCWRLWAAARTRPSAADGSIHGTTAAFWEWISQRVSGWHKIAYISVRTHKMKLGTTINKWIWRRISKEETIPAHTWPLLWIKARAPTAWMTLRPIHS